MKLPILLLLASTLSAAAQCPLPNSNGLPCPTDPPKCKDPKGCPVQQGGNVLRVGTLVLKMGRV